MLVRLAAIEVDELTELLTDGWRVQAPKRLVAEYGEIIKPGDRVNKRRAASAVQPPRRRPR